MNIREEIAGKIQGDILDSPEIIRRYSRDTSIFTRTPSLVVAPKNADDISALVKIVAEKKAAGENVSLTGRSAGTDMSGGSLTDSIVVSFTEHMNSLVALRDTEADVEPGMYYRDFEKETLGKKGVILPSYPASRELCAIGGIVSNNSGGELTLRYGKTERYVRALDVVLSDGSKATIRPLSFTELEEKKKEQTFEGKMYRDVSNLIEVNKQEIASAKPSVTKNSAGYSLWNVVDEEKKTFDLTQLIVGSQGTLAMVTRATLGLVRVPPERAMLVVFMKDLDTLPEIVRRVMLSKPESFESYDDQTFGLAVRFIPQIIGHLGLVKMVQLGLAFLPEMWAVLTGGIPKLVLMAEFAEDTHEEALSKAREAEAALRDMHVQTKVAKSPAQIAKYWTIRRESFRLLRKNMKGLYAAPFIDDIVVHPNDYPTFLPELNELIKGHKFIYTIAGHIGDGNFHIIPLENMSDPEARAEIVDLMPKVYKLVAKYKGSITGEHNDGIVRTPYLPLMFSPKIIELFEETKNIFDPQDIFNPGKKVRGSVADIEKYILTHS